jgi:hypothetical protein
MSDCYINVRIGLYHLKLKRNFRITIERNDCHIGYPRGRFKVCEFWPFK